MESACKEVVDGLSTVRASATKFDIDRMTLLHEKHEFNYGIKWSGWHWRWDGE